MFGAANPITDNYNQLKQFKYDELSEIVPHGFHFKTKPRRHQLACFLASIANDGFLDNLDLGLGKTKVAIDLCVYLQQMVLRRPIRVLTVCLNNAVENWADEVHKHSDLNAVCLRGRIEDRWDLIQGNGFFIVNFEGLRHMVSVKVQKMSRNGEAINKQTASDRLIQRLARCHFDVLIVDESHVISNMKSLVTKVVMKIAEQIHYRYNLTGTLFGNSLLAVWPQYFVVDNGETFGNNFYRWRQAYFKDVGFFGADWVPTQKGKQIIQQSLWNRAIRFSEDEVDDLPIKVYNVIEYKLTGEQRADYDHMLDKLNYDGPVKNKHMAFRQICSGFMYATEKRYDENPKLDHLLEIIEQAIECSKVVVFHEFIQEYVLIAEQLKKRKIGYCVLNGQINDKHSEIVAFSKDSKKKVMIAHPVSGGSSINLVSAAYCVFFSNGGSVINRKQCEKRVHRMGQTSKRVFYYDLVAKASIEVTMLRNLMNGLDALETIVDGKSLRKALMGG